MIITTFLSTSNFRTMATDSYDSPRKRKLKVQKQNCAKKQKSMLESKGEFIDEFIYAIYQCYNLFIIFTNYLTLILNKV